MIDKNKMYIERELHKIEKQLKAVSGIKKHHKLLKRQQELKNELKSINTRKK
jgi:hypothetical protein